MLAYLGAGVTVVSVLQNEMLVFNEIAINSHTHYVNISYFYSKLKSLSLLSICFLTVLCSSSSVRNVINFSPVFFMFIVMTWKGEKMASILYPKKATDTLVFAAVVIVLLISNFDVTCNYCIAINQHLAIR